MSYPPDRHVLRDLPFELEAVDGSRSRAHLRVVPEVCQDGVLAAGPLMTVADVVAGGLVGRVIAPDWMATAQLSLHLDRPPALDDAAGREVVIDAEVIRDGRTTMVVEAALRTDDGRDFGEAMLTFVRLPRRDTNIDMSAFPVTYGERSGFAVEGSGFRAPWAEAIGVPADGGLAATGVEVTEYVRNSFGAVNGGVVASIAAEAARREVRAAVGAPARVVDAVVTYLTQGKEGPLVTSARIVRRDAAGALVRTEVADGSRVMVVAHVHCTS